MSPRPWGVRPEALVGRTPLLRLDRLSREVHPSVVLAKAEWCNPGGSVKDRPALRMIEEGERSGRLRAGGIILDATSGNTGIAYAWIAAARGYRVKLAIPSSAGPARLRALRALGADLVLTDPLDGSDGAIREVRRILDREPGRYFHPDQYNNPFNWRAHYDTTALEIWEQTGGSVTDFVCGLGTSGTFTGVGRRLRKLNPAVRLASVQPDSPLHGLEGLKHMATALVPGIYDPGLADEDQVVPTERAYRMVRRLAAEEGLLVGVSSGAALAAALEVAARRPGGVVVTVFPDGGDRYSSAPIWEEEQGGRAGA